jgi:hypothetical protein
MNTQEKEPELGEGVTSAEYWMYDGKLGRRWNVDPIYKHSESLFLTFGNCPIFYKDLLGDDIEDPTGIKNNAKAYANDQIKYLNSDLNKLNKKIGRQTNKIRNTDNSKKVERLTRKIRKNLAEKKNLEGIKSEYENFLNEVEELENDPTVNIRVGTAGEDIPTSRVQEDGTFILYTNSVDEFAHELIHAYQFFKTGSIDYLIDGSAGPLYDINDEVAAFKRQFAFASEVTTDNDFYNNGIHTLDQVTRDYVANRWPQYAVLSYVDFNSLTPFKRILDFHASKALNNNSILWLNTMNTLLEVYILQQNKCLKSCEDHSCKNLCLESMPYSSAQSYPAPKNLILWPLR